RVKGRPSIRRSWTCWAPTTTTAPARFTLTTMCSRVKRWMRRTTSCAKARMKNASGARRWRRRSRPTSRPKGASVCNFEAECQTAGESHTHFEATVKRLSCPNPEGSPNALLYPPRPCADHRDFHRYRCHATCRLPHHANGNDGRAPLGGLRSGQRFPQLGG